jgi:hypothetical protein
MNSETRPTRSRQLRQLRALMAPLAANRGSVIADMRHLAVARALCDALLHEDADGGLTRSQLLTQVAPELRELADTRIDVFAELGLLQTYTEKRHQQRYVLNMAGYIGLMVAERIGDRGGIEELLRLLHRTRQDIEAGQISDEIVAERLTEARRIFVGFANELRRRRVTDTVRELAGYAREHDSQQTMDEVVSLSNLVADQFPTLSERAASLIRAAQSYTRELEAVATRLIDEGASTRDFSFLDPAEYDEAARNASFNALAAVAETVVFDLGNVPVSPSQVAQALSSYRPRTLIRRRPPQLPVSSEADPLARWEQQRENERNRAERDAELFLQGNASVELTDRLRATAWQGVRKTLAQLLAIHQHLPARYIIHLNDSVLIDSDAEASYFSPATLHRLEHGLPTSGPSAQLSEASSQGNANEDSERLL